MRDDFYDDDNLYTDEEYAQRVDREVHRIVVPDGEFEITDDGEILRESRDTSNQEIEQEIEQESQPSGSVAKEPLTEEQIEEERKRDEAIKRKQNRFWGILSGAILVNKGVSQAYIHLLCIALALFINIVMVFFNMSLDSKYTSLSRQTQLLRERTYEYKTLRFSKTSHSAITEKVKQRGLPLYTPQVAKTIIDD